ncbi:hypothetical protein AC630_29940 [Bradyrhizobium sp. AS23.2]|nr:hypothetical protein AC630_29940 [Bradyrhizobium sp. AS23.2]
MSLRRHCAHEIDARYVDQFGDLLETDFRLPTGDDFGHGLARRGPRTLRVLPESWSATPSFLKPIVER